MEECLRQLSCLGCQRPVVGDFVQAEYPALRQRVPDDRQHCGARARPWCQPAERPDGQAMARSRSSLSTTVHVACDALDYPLGFILTAAICAFVNQLGGIVVVPLRNPIVVPNPHSTKISIANVIALRTSLPASKHSAASSLATKNSTLPSHPCSPSPAS